MKIIRQESKWFSRHIVRQPRNGNDYRCSKFVVRMEVPDGYLLYNVVSGALYMFQNDEESIFLETLISNWFYVSNDFNELDWVDFLRNKKRKGIKQGVITGYTIMTTLDCNARCFYCYEKGRPRTMMSEQTAIDLANYIIENAHGNFVHISWFGGEPLFNYKVIDIICQKLASAKINFSSSMISNGLLFSPLLVEKAVSIWNLKRTQITLDGTQEVYLKSKAFVNSDGSEFEKVLNNIELLHNNNIMVNIRLNQDVYNTDDLLKLIDLLENRFVGCSGVKVYNHLLFSKDNIVSYEQMNSYFKLRNKILQANLLPTPKLSKGPRVNHCMADSPTSLVVTPDGRLGKCEHFSSEFLVGSIYEKETNEKMVLKWMERKDRQDECYSCVLVPICDAIKMCPNENPKCSEFERESKLQSLRQAILNAYNNYCLKNQTNLNRD